MSKFMISNGTAEQHQSCINQCGKNIGPLLVCMNLEAAAKKPCSAIIHAECAGYELSVVPHLSTYFCRNCTKTDEQLQQRMQKVDLSAAKAARISTLETVSIADYNKLKLAAEKLDKELKKKNKEVNEQKTKISELENECKTQRESFKLQSRQIQELQAGISTLEKVQESKLIPATFSSTLVDQFNETIREANEISNNKPTVSQKGANNSSISRSLFNSSNNATGWPDYDQQQHSASEQDEHSLLLIRNSLAKPMPFDGDVTKWSTFLSEFVRTSARGHFRDFEDMDRLRELISGEAREMFTTELSDPCAEALSTLKRLDEFYGVKGSAVRVALDRITQLPKVEKTNDKPRLTSLYTHAKQFALQCRIYSQEHELSSESSLFILESKMLSEHVKAWRSWTKSNQRREDVDGLIAFVEDQIRELSLSNVKSKPTATANVHTTDVTGGREDKASSSSNSTSEKSHDRSVRSEKNGRNKRRDRYANCECFHCKDKHPFYRCPQLVAANDAKRVEIVNRLHVCTRCLSSNKHEARRCPNRLPKCSVAGCTAENKHPLLHGHPNEQIRRYTATNAHIDVHCMQMASHFAMVPGDAIAADGTRIPITIMFDGGSGISLATAKLFEKSKAESQMDYELTLRWATDITHTESNAKVFSLKFVPQGRSKAVILENLSAVSELKLPSQEQDSNAFRQQFVHLRDVPLPSYRKQAPQILLGLSHARFMAHLSSVTSDRDGEPVAALTPLGWTVYGSSFESTAKQAGSKSLILGFTCNGTPSEEITNDELLKYIRSCNDVESIGIAHKDASLLSANDQQAESVIRSTMKFVAKEGRYEVGLLLRDQLAIMPDNYRQAVQRLMSTENRLKRLNMLEFVQQQFQEEINKGWLIETTREECNKYPRRNYVYGFLTFNNNKTPPKPRWVNDTASTFKGVSLNSMLLKGPDNLVPLPQSMCCQREGKYAFQGDVRSMFNQVMLKEEDQYSQLTLWRNGDSSAEPRIFRQTRVIFGPACSPSVTSSIRVHHAEQCKSEFPEAADVAINQMYVDDAPDSRDTLEEATKVAKDLITMFARIGWPLVEFQSNSTSFLDCLPPEHVSKKMVDIGRDNEELITKVLGIFWKPKQDVYIYRLNDDTIIRKGNEENYMPTKKEMLSMVMRIFDPLGQISPFRIRGHMIFQHVWRAGTDWRKRPPKEICDEFNRWLQDFSRVAKLEIPRPYAPDLLLKDCELSLHVFVDAGAEAYAACAYIRIQREDTVVVRLIASKAKVAPIKYMSIPRLELMSGLIGARLLRSVMQWHRRLNFVDYSCWTDSDVSFKWIRSHHLPRTAFTAPRIAEIQELTSADKWKYVPTKLNVADYATKERQMDYSDSNHEWFTGPKFLYESPENWPKQPVIKPNVVTTVAATQASNDESVNSFAILTHLPGRIRSYWSRLTRAVALALRFAYRLMPQRNRRRETGHLKPYEVERGENYVIRLVQIAAFPEEYRNLIKHKRVKKSSSIYSLSPIMCESTGLIRATTRLSSSFPLNMRSPPILPYFHEITDAILRYYHNLNLHVGDKAIVAHIRSRVWIINVKRAVRRCRARCLFCIERRVVPATANRGELPDFRLDIHQKPFFHTGCDLFGPVVVYSGRSGRKIDVHVVIFTCMVTRAVYFEVLDDKSTECFLSAFEKLWARRGPISHVYSDNGTNFTGAARFIDIDEVQRKTVDKKINWHFNPPFTPMFGGAWERLIRDTKRGLDASLGKFVVPRLSMETALAQIEANLNNRPLTEIPVSSFDDFPITPQILMTGYPNYPYMDDSSSKEVTTQKEIMKLKPAKRINALIQAFRHRFIAEYAPIISRRPRNSAKAHNMLKLNDFVIYMDPTKNPADWQRGIITKIYPGKDGAVRVADIKLRNGPTIERRSAHLIAKLDVKFERPEAESDKYDRYCGVLVTASLNLLSPKVSNKTCKQKNVQIPKENFKMPIQIRSQKYDIFPAVDGPELSRSGNVDLSEQDKMEYIDKSGEKLIFVKNLPPDTGAGEIFTIMSQYGRVQLIGIPNLKAGIPFSAFIGYEDKASVDTVSMYNRSQVIETNQFLYKQHFEKLTGTFNPNKSIQQPIYAWLDIESAADMEKSKVLMITSGRKDRKIIPISGRFGGLIHCCPSRYYFDIEKQPFASGNIVDLPVFHKQEGDAVAIHDQRQHIVEPCVHNAVKVKQYEEVPVRRKVQSAVNNISVSVDYADISDDDEYNQEALPDLRQLIESRQQLANIRDRIHRPKKSSKSRKLLTKGGTM